MHRSDFEARCREGETASCPGTSSSEGLRLGAIRTIPELLQRRIEDTPEHVAYSQFDHQAGRWESSRWKDVGQLVAQEVDAQGFERLLRAHDKHQQ